MQETLKRLGAALCACMFASCLAIHLMTFFTTVSLVWILPAVGLLAAAVLCANAIKTKPRLSFSNDKYAFLGCVLLVYAVLTFIYFYKTTGGASSVGSVDGHYVSEYQGHTIRTITEKEYRAFPNLWTRVMSAWIAMAAVFCARAFTLERLAE